VVLISGHQEFELAKQALRYNVHDYLLKPTDLDEVYRVFQDLKRRLDLERAERDRTDREKAQWHQMAQQYKERYLPHLLLRTSADEEEIQRQFEIIGMAVNPSTCACAGIQLTGPSELSAEYVQRAFLHSLPEDLPALALLPVGEPALPLQLLAVSADADADGLAVELTRLLEQASARFQSLFGFALQWSVQAVHGPMMDWLDRHRQQSAPSVQTAECEPKEERSGNENGQLSRERKVITQAKEYVNANLKREISLAEVADHVYLNPVYLGRLFKAETGRSFSDYVAGTRMELAAALVRDTNLKIYEICEQVGYKDVRHFYKLFRKHMGHLPREYREQRM
jgi:two-component system response regulator YesN